VSFWGTYLGRVLIDSVSGEAFWKKKVKMMNDHYIIYVDINVTLNMLILMSMFMVYHKNEKKNEMKKNDYL